MEVTNAIFDTTISLTQLYLLIHSSINYRYFLADLGHMSATTVMIQWLAFFRGCKYNRLAVFILATVISCVVGRGGKTHNLANYSS